MRARASLLLALAPLASCDVDDPFVHAKQLVAEKMRDDSSLRFRNVRKCGDGEMVIGEVNGKNAFGGYAGYQHFVSSPDAAAVMGSDDENFVTLMRQCTLETIKQTLRIEGVTDQAEIDRRAAELQSQDDANAAAEMNAIVPTE